jgi:glyoxylase-like metal-dependent hydrolase (beta-lactamase superfamily II)
MAMLKAIQPVPVDGVFEDNEEPFFLPGVQIIYTPGHVPRHISLYIKESKTFIAADAIVVENEQLAIANPQFTMDLQQAIASIRRIEQLDIEKMICYHDGVVKKDIKKQLSNLIKKYAQEYCHYSFSGVTYLFIVFVLLIGYFLLAFSCM